jgi:leukotriene-A4 hydrolase
MADEAQRIGPTELIAFLQALPSPLPTVTCAALDRLFDLSARTNAEIRVNWILVQLRAGLEAGRAAAREALLATGRLRHLRALYAELCTRREMREFARQVFAEAKCRYHPIARTMIEDLLRRSAEGSEPPC